VDADGRLGALLDSLKDSKLYPNPVVFKAIWLHPPSADSGDIAADNYTLYIRLDRLAAPRQTAASASAKPQQNRQRLSRHHIRPAPQKYTGDRTPITELCQESGRRPGNPG
jgi:hypothetical protein